MSAPKKQALPLRAAMTAAACLFLSAWGGSSSIASSGNANGSGAALETASQAGACKASALRYAASKLASGAAITRALAPDGSPGNAPDAPGNASGSPLPPEQQDGNTLVGIAVDGAGNVFVSAYRSGNLYELPTGRPGAVTRASSTTGGAGQMAYSAKNGRIYLADWWSGTVVGFDPARPPPVFDPDDASTLTGAWADIGLATGVSADADGNVYVVENGTVSYSSSYTTAPAGAGTIDAYPPADAPMSTDTPASATLAIGSSAFAPTEIAAAPASDGDASATGANLYVTDQTHHEIFRLTANGGAPTVFAGSGTAGTQDGTGAAASFSMPTGIAADACGNVYVADQGSGRVRRITPTGVVTTVYAFPDNGATAPTALALDARGNLYVATQGAKAGVWKLAPKPDA